MRLSDLAIAALLLIGGAALAIGAWGYPNLPMQAYGAATFPLAIGFGMIGIGAALALADLRARARAGAAGAPRPPFAALEGWGRHPGSWARLALTLGLVVAYLALAPLFGFLLAGGALLLGLMLTFRTPLLHAALVTPLAIAAVSWAFGSLLRVPLPRSSLFAGFW